jgi:hypothetical protein
MKPDFVGKMTKTYTTIKVKIMILRELLAEWGLAAIVPPPDPPVKVSGPFGDRLMAGLQFLVLAI